MSLNCLPSVLIFRAVLTKANKVALNMTVPSLFRGMFMATNLCRRLKDKHKNKYISGTTDETIYENKITANVTLPSTK